MRNPFIPSRQKIVRVADSYLMFGVVMMALASACVCVIRQIAGV